MTGAMRSTPRKIERELGWRPAETFETGIRKTVQLVSRSISSGSDNVQSGAYREWIDTPIRERNAVAMTSQRHHSRRRLRHAAVSGHHRGVQAAAADLRQADDLLSAVHADAGRHPRHPDHLDAAGYAALRAAAGRRQPVGAESQLCRAAQSRTAWRRLSSSAAISSARTFGAWCSATIFSMATSSPTICAPRRRAASDGATVFAYQVHDPERYGVVEFDAEGTRDQPGRKAATAEVALCRDRPVFLRQPRARHRRRTEAFARAANWKSPTSTASISSSGALEVLGDGARPCLARYRHPRIADRGLAVHRDHREAAGAEDRLPRRDRLAHGLDRQRRARAAGTDRWPRAATASICSACCDERVF